MIDKKLKEEWWDILNSNLLDRPLHMVMHTQEELFYEFLDRAYALGKQEKEADTVIVDKEEYDKLCKRSRYVANWVPYYSVCPIYGEFNPRGYICANCDNDKNWNK